MVNKVIILLVALCLFCEASAQNVSKKEDIKFFFEINRFDFKDTFSTNAEQLRILDGIMADENALVGLDSLQVVATASLDGNVRKNGILAINRGKAIKSLLLGRYSKIMPGLVRSTSVAEEWVEFRAMIESDDNVPYKAEVIRLLDSKREVDAKEWVLRTMKSGVVWDYLKSHILPKGRYGASIVFYYNINRKEMIQALDKKKEVIYLRDTIITRDTLRVVDTIRVDMRIRKFKKNYDTEMHIVHKDTTK